MTRVLALAVVWLFLAALGCTPAVGEFACAADEECAPEFRCVEGVCLLTATTADGGQRPRDGGGDDAGARADAGSDAGATRSDGGQATDGGTVTDADGGASVDAGADADAGTVVDGGTATDSGTAADSGAAADSGTAVDAGGDADAGASDAGVVDAGGVDAGPVDDRSCATLLASGVVADGVYAIDPDGPGGGAPFDVFCAMTVAGGGWALALKDDGRSSSFGYDDALWTNTTGVNETGLDLSMVEAKTEAFWRAPFKEVLVVFSEQDPGGAPDLFAGSTTTIVLPAIGTSLRWLFASGVTVPTGAARATWLALQTGSDLQDNCNAEGFNVRPRPDNTTNSRARIGIVANEQGECISPDSRLGVGLGGDTCNTNANLSTGDSTGCDQNGDRNVAAFAAVFVRDAAPDAAWPLASCAAWRDGGMTTSGYAFVDHDPNDAIPPVELYCEQTVDGGGWALVGRSHSSGGRPFGWTSQLGHPRLDGAPYSLDVELFALPVTDILIGSWTSAKTLGPDAHKWVSVPMNFVTAYRTNDFQINGVTTVLGNCSPNANGMFERIGHTGRDDVFFSRDNGGSDTYGLEPTKWDLAYSDCARGGNLRDLNGMIFIR